MIWINFQDENEIKVYTNFVTGGYVHGQKDVIVDYLNLAEDPIGMHIIISMIQIKSYQKQQNYHSASFDRFPTSTVYNLLLNQGEIHVVSADILSTLQGLNIFFIHLEFIVLFRMMENPGSCFTWRLREIQLPWRKCK